MEKNKKYSRASSSNRQCQDLKVKSNNAIQDFQPGGRAFRGRRWLQPASPSSCQPPPQNCHRTARQAVTSDVRRCRQPAAAGSSTASGVSALAERRGGEQIEVTADNFDNTGHENNADAFNRNKGGATAADNNHIDGAAKHVQRRGGKNNITGGAERDSVYYQRAGRKAGGGAAAAVGTGHHHHHHHAIDASHLLNFHIEAARDAHVERYSGSQWRRLRTNRGFERSTHSHSRYSRPRHVQEQYLQARCQFIVCKDAPLSANYSDPDTLVDWSYVQQVRLFDDTSTVCAICLHVPPLHAGRLTRCGHVYCWPCMLHYLSLSDRPHRPCPICEQPVSVGELYSCQLLQRQTATVGGQLTFCLMRRDRYSLQPHRVGDNNGDTGDDSGAGGAAGGGPYVSLDDSGERQQLARIVLASPQQVETQILDAEQSELERQLAELCGEPHVCFVQQALQLLEERRLQLAAWHQQLAARPRRPITTTAVSSSSSSSSCCNGVTGDDGGGVGTSDVASAGAGSAVGEVKSSVDESTVVYQSAFDDQKWGCDDDNTGRSITNTTAGIDTRSAGTRSRAVSGASSEISADLECSPVAGGEVTDNNLASTPPHSDQPYYFYQVENGQPIFMHALSTRMLLEEHGGSWSSCPRQLTLSAVDIDTLTVDDKVRRRLPSALSHVAVTTQLQLVVVQLQPPLVSPRTLAMFRDQLRRREQRRRDRERRERQLQQRHQQQPPRRQRSPHSFTFSVPEDDLSFLQQTVEDSGVANDAGHSDVPSFAQLVRSGGGTGRRTAVKTGGGGEDDDNVGVTNDGWSVDLAEALRRIDQQQQQEANGQGASTADAARGSKKKNNRKGRGIVLCSGLPF